MHGPARESEEPGVEHRRVVLTPDRVQVEVKWTNHLDPHEEWYAPRSDVWRLFLDLLLLRAKEIIPWIKNMIGASS